MEYNLAHALLGRFGVLIPLLGLFFELGALISQKKLVSKISAGIVILGGIVVLLAGITGIQEYFYLKGTYGDIEELKIHFIAGLILMFLFALIILLRVFILFRPTERLIVLYFVIYVVSVMANLFSNEVVVHLLRGDTG
ncbi:MAG: hypothetical protein GXO45_01260 [Aquificae bacterium]|nr:hypothetical protein [Aquificota bacterium]